MLQRAGVAGFFEAAVEGIKSGAQVIEKHEANEAESEVAAALWKRLAKLRTIHETRHVIKHGRAEKRLCDLHDEWAAIGLCDEQIAPEKEPKLEEEGHDFASSTAKS